MIYQKNYYIENPKATIIIVHGIAEHSGRYEYLANRFNQIGLDVVTYDHPGHGKSGGDRGKIKSYNDIIDTLHNIVLSERKRNNNKIFLLGHSMGGGTVNIYEAKYGDVDGIVSVAAATNTPSNMKLLRLTGFYFLRKVKINTKIFDKDLAHDPNVLAQNKLDPLMLKYMYVSLIGEMFIKGTKFLHKNINNFKTPILYIHGTSDNIVDYRFSEYMFNNIPTKDKEIKLYPNEFHELLNDYNKETVINDILEWLKLRI